MMENNVGRKCWPLGRILEIIPGEDGNVRVVKVLRLGKEVLRSVGSVCPLELVDPRSDQEEGNVK